MVLYHMLVVALMEMVLYHKLAVVLMEMVRNGIVPHSGGHVDGDQGCGSGSRAFSTRPGSELYNILLRKCVVNYERERTIINL
jgi:hypothetical protein